MATKNFTGTPKRADHTGTAPLPPAAKAALARLERAFLPLPLVRAVTRYEIAAARYDELIARPASDLSPAEFDSIGDAQQTMAETFGVLAEAGRADLVESAVVARVGAALGFRRGWKPDPYFDETATHLTVWSQYELNDLYLRVGGTVTTRRAERRSCDGDATWTATEITLTVDVDGVGPVEIVTDIEDDPEHGYRTDLPVVAVARYREAAEHCRTASAAADFDGCLAAQDEMAMCRCQLAAAGRLDLIGAA
jgi:hypothetical protein